MEDKLLKHEADQKDAFQRAHNNMDFWHIFKGEHGHTHQCFDECFCKNRQKGQPMSKEEAELAKLQEHWLYYARLALEKVFIFSSDVLWKANHETKVLTALWKSPTYDNSRNSVLNRRIFAYLDWQVDTADAPEDKESLLRILQKTSHIKTAGDKRILQNLLAFCAEDYQSPERT